MTKNATTCERCGKSGAEVYWDDDFLGALCEACIATLNAHGDLHTEDVSIPRGRQAHFSHAACYAAKAHDKSPAGRAGCRKLNTREDLS